MTVDMLQSQGALMPAQNVCGIARAPFFALERTPEVAAFIEKYRAACEEYPTDWVINAYDGLKFYAAAEHAGSVGPEAVMKAAGEGTVDGLRETGLKARWTGG